MVYWVNIFLRSRRLVLHLHIIEYVLLLALVYVYLKYYWANSGIKDFTNAPHAHLSWASVLTSYQILPRWPCTFSTVLFQVEREQPLLRLSCGFQLKSIFAISVSDTYASIKLALKMCTKLVSLSLWPAHEYYLVTSKIVERENIFIELLFLAEFVIIFASFKLPVVVLLEEAVWFLFRHISGVWKIGFYP